MRKQSLGFFFFLYKLAIEYGSMLILELRFAFLRILCFIEIFKI